MRSFRASPPNPRLVLPVLLGLLPLGPIAVAGQNRGTVVGIVVDQVSGEPVVDADVTVMRRRTSARTDVDGMFVLSGLPVGTVQVSVERPGYSSSVEQVEVAADSGSALVVPL